MNVVFTAITSGKDTLKEDQNTTNADFIAYLDEPVESKTWEVITVKHIGKDPVRNAKQYKVLAHRFLEADYSLWIDGTIVLVDTFDSLVDKYLKEHDIALHKHYMRDCIYNEAMYCGSYKLDDPDVIAKQVARYYTRDKYPRNNGLAECTIILRRHTDKIKELNELWWKEIQEGSRRDQISFNYCCWKLGIKYKEMDNTVYNDKSFKYFKHLRRENELLPTEQREGI